MFLISLYTFKGHQSMGE